jgi:two-component system, LytTR family, sensor kinase
VELAGTPFPESGDRQKAESSISTYNMKKEDISYRFVPAERMQKTSKYYWWLQLGGWGILALILILINVLFGQRVDQLFLIPLCIKVLAGIFTTHLFRFYIHRAGWLVLPVEKALPRLALGILIVCLLDTIIRISVINWLDPLSSTKKLEFSTRFMLVTVENGLYIIPWTLIYYFFHYIEKSRKQLLDTLKLEALVKELELKTIKSHINPHFIFNALNSIRALIDENPLRARTAITELSNILRSSMQTEKQETVFFEKELDIVKDYLALEHIRFEDRLNVQYEIAENTLTQPIPPMMLQTLVENAIKHGISKQVSGGTVTIVSRMKEHYHQLVIRNTGRLNKSGDEDGFGLVSTRNRLQLLFGEQANFYIREINENMVEAELHIPLT